MLKTKKLWVLGMFCMVFFAGSAQKYTSPVKEFYENLPKNNRISAVNISHRMLSLTLSVASAFDDSNELDSLKQLVSGLNEIILIGQMDESVFPDDTMDKMLNSLKKKGYETMSTMREGAEMITVRVLHDKLKPNVINDFVVVIIDGKERMVLSISGELTYQQLMLVAQYADIDLSNFIRI